MSQFTDSVTGRIDDLVCRLEAKLDGSDELLTYNPDTGVASLATFREGQQARVTYGHIIGGRFVQAAMCCLIGLFVVGCTGSASMSWGPKGTEYEQRSQPSQVPIHAWDAADHQ